MTTSRAFVIGKTPKSVARRETRWAHNQKFPKGTTKLDGWQMNAVQRYHDLDRLATHRRRHAPDLGDEQAWARIIANLCRVRDNQVSVSSVNITARRLHVGPLDQTIVNIVVRDISVMAWGNRYPLYTPEEAGKLLRVTKVEREAADLEKIDAIDEPGEERKRRLDRERKRRERELQAAAKPPTKAEIAKALGISRPTLDAWIKAGKVDPETGEVDFTKSVRRSKKEYIDHRTENVKLEEAA